MQQALGSIQTSTGFQWESLSSALLCPVLSLCLPEMCNLSSTPVSLCAALQGFGSAGRCWLHWPKNGMPNSRGWLPTHVPPVACEFPDGAGGRLAVCALIATDWT